MKARTNPPPLKLDVRSHHTRRRSIATALGLGLAPLLAGTATAQLAVDRLHGYAVTGAAAYTPAGTGHTMTGIDTAMDIGTSGTTILTVTDPAFLAAVNSAATNDQLTVSLWVNHYSVTASSGFWFYSQSANASGNTSDRGFQAHIPWSNDNIYFDTAGCCDTSLERINAPISNLADYVNAGIGDDWWKAWHHFVFIKNHSDKQVWIDGNLFLEGQSSLPLPTDMFMLTIGSGAVPPGGTASLQGQIDDFAVFGAALATNDVAAIASGTSPMALTSGMSTNLLAFWDFNLPGTVMSAVQAGPGATVTPDISGYYVIANGTTAVQLNTIQLAINGTNVTSGLTILNSNATQIVEGSLAGATVYYVSPVLFAAGTTQTVTLTYSDNATPPTQFSNTWPVIIEPYNGYVVDSQAGYIGFLEGSAVFTADKGGHTGAAGDRAIDLSGVGSAGDIHVGSANFLNQAATNTTMSVSLWMKMHAISSGGTFFARSPSSGGGQRGFAARCWSDDNIYFETAGCCDASAQQISAPISQMPNYVDDGFWTQWHHYAFVYDNSLKEIYVDGYELGINYSYYPLPTDFRDLLIGFDPADGVYQQAIVDDVAIFGSALQPGSISSLTNGVSPTALSGEVLLSYWNMNTLSPGPPFVSLSSTPAANATNVAPNVSANILIVNRNTQVQPASILLWLDGANVTSITEIIPSVAGATVAFITPTNLPPLSTHTISVAFSDNATPPNLVTNTWSFKTGTYGGYANDVTHNYLALFRGNTHFSPGGSGRTGQPTDHSLDLWTDGAGGANCTDSTFLAAINQAASSNTMTISYWMRQSALNSASTVWLNSPSAGRDLNGHVPYGTGGIVYFDTSGCCAASQRINANISTLAAYANSGQGAGWWTNWHHFVLMKNGSDKQIWIDGNLFLEGTGTAPFTTDINNLFIGYGNGVASPYGQMDDFAIFGDALSTTSISALAGGASPMTLGDTNLVAFWDFNEVGPPFVAARTPSPASTGNFAYGPLGVITAQIIDGTTAVNTNTVRLLLNGSDITANAVLGTPVSGLTTLRYVYAPTGVRVMPSLSSNLVTVLAYDNATPPNLISNSWYFVTERYNAITHDVVHGYPGLIQPSGHFTISGAGESGQPGDYAVDLSTSGGPIHIDDATFMYPAETNQTLTFSFWCKKYDIANSSTIWVNSPSSSGTARGVNLHLPYGDVIYYDTAGCCASPGQRLSAAINTLPGYVSANIGDGWWTNWHQFVVVYNLGSKQIYIDGQPFFTTQSGTTGASPLPLDFTDMWIGRDQPDNLNAHGLVDDFAVFSTAVSPASVALLASGTLPNLVPGENLIAYWNFNDVAVARPTISISAAGHSVTINFTGILQSASAPGGPYTDMTGAPNPYTVTVTAAGAQKYYRARD